MFSTQEELLKLSVQTVRSNEKSFEEVLNWSSYQYFRPGGQVESKLERFD